MSFVVSSERALSLVADLKKWLKTSLMIKMRGGGWVSKELDQVFRFLLVGGLIFIIDGFVLFSLIKVFSLSPLVSRIVSCLIALLAAFFLHARFTFFTSASTVTLIRFLMMQSISTGLNFSVYGFWLAYGYSFQGPLIGLIIGSILATIFNYCANKYFVYR